MARFSLFSLLFFCLSLTFISLAWSQPVTIEPHGFSLAVEQGGRAELDMSLVNSSDTGYLFNIRYQLMSVENERQGGPRRDDPGDIIREVQVPYYNTVGMAYDPQNGWVWGLAWSDRRLYALNPENNQVVVNVAVNASILGLCYRNGVLYAGGYNNNPNIIFRYDLQGRALENLRCPRNLTWTDIACDDNYLYTATYPNGGGRGDVHVLDFNNNLEEVAVIDCNEWIGEEAWGIEIIPDHRRGFLWLSDRERLYQFFIDDDWNADLLQSFVAAPSSHCGMAHDGENLWLGHTTDKLVSGI